MTDATDATDATDPTDPTANGQPPSRLRRSPLDDRHRALGATMTAFGGWDMPLDYGSVVAEHRAVRSTAGVFDLSHLGTLRVTGPQATEVIARAFTNDVRRLPVGRAQYSLCLDDDGGILDDLLVYHLPWGYLVVPNAANAAAVLESVRAAAAGRDAQVVDVKEALACLAVQGPRSLDVVRSGAGVDPGDLDYLDCQVLGQPVPDANDLAVLARSGYTGERGYELFVPAGQAPRLWDRLVAAGAVPVGLGARDTLRLEMGYPLHGADIYLDASPVEARLGWACRGSGFRGEQAYRRHTADSAARRLLGLRATGRGIPRAGQIVFRAGGQQPVGETTSGTFSPTLGLGIALAYMDSEIAEGDALEVDVRGRRVAVVAARPPFVDADPRA